ncbi:Lsr2 family protein [Gordonia alkaliphila]|uniref:Lsr2 family DNA-binding protein n=1 Tax=Gordonia alkaliphila TaxID=1053547 RepID=UPI001FF4345C|nr:histone-like nucleoid-structuring protein Lsr2 [Gordonia alkaliphila]MCK0441164.1 Lsr2 family protein [Gordonia alkaliphila]
MTTRSVTVTEHIDDLTGEIIGSGVRTVHWVWDGRPLKFDVGPEGMKALESGTITLSALLKASRDDGDDGERASRQQIRKSNRAVREWARENGWDVGVRGRISAEIIEAYQSRADS